ncbi:Hypothetical predicted protein, partial [Marmota monax]
PKASYNEILFHLPRLRWDTRGGSRLAPAKPDQRRKPGLTPCASPEEAHQPLKPIKGSVATSTLLRLIQ